LHTQDCNRHASLQLQEQNASQTVQIVSTQKFHTFGCGPLAGQWPLYVCSAHKFKRYLSKKIKLYKHGTEICVTNLLDYMCVMCDTHCFCWYFCLSNFRWTNCFYLECSANLIFMSFPNIISLAYCFLDFNDNERVNEDVVVCSHLVPIRIFFSAYSLR